MKSIIASLFFFCILTSSTFAIGMAMPPSKTFNAFIGQEFSISAVLINEEAATGNYSVSFGGDLSDRASANPQTVVINPPVAVTHRGNAAEDGTATVKISVNSTGLTPGTYSLAVSTSISSGNKGTFNVIQKVTRTVHIQYKYPPSLMSKIINGVYLFVKSGIDWIVGILQRFYEQNRWLDQMFFALILMTVFYIGMRMDRIIRHLSQMKKAFLKEIERIKKQGFFAWLRRKIKDRFKKVKTPAKEEGHDDGEKKSVEDGIQ